MKQLLRERFLPMDFEYILYTKYQQCKQKQRSVEYYTEKFHRLAGSNNTDETEEQLVARYIGGLKFSI